MTTISSHDVVIIGGGTAGITVAARLRNKGVKDIVIVDPASTHWYQPLWTLVGAGLVNAKVTAKPMASVIPRGVTWIQKRVTTVDPSNNVVFVEGDGEIRYSWLVVAAGIQLDWNKIEGLTETLGKNGVSSNYLVETAEATWSNVATMTSGTAVFAMPSGPIKCAGAPQKIAYLAADHWKRKGVLKNIDIHLILPTPAMFGIKEFSDTLEKVVQRYGIKVHLNSEVTSVNGESKTVAVHDKKTDETKMLAFDMAHLVPPQSAPDWIKNSPLSDQENPGKYVKVDKHTLRHTEFENVFALGDCTTTPNSKTGAAIRKQAPVLVANLLAAREGKSSVKQYDGYASCPIVTSSKTCVMAEFDYELKRTPSFPVIDMTKERRDMYVLKRYFLPWMYWKMMLKGRA